eukprot:2262-Heterococcus_DN1.PRE.2
MPTPASKRRIAAATSAIMYNPGLVDCMLSFLVGQGLFVATVSKLWLQSYARAVAESSRAPIETPYRAAFESASRILVAVHSYKLILDNDEVLYLAGLCADAKTLRRAFALGMPMSSAVVEGAAESGRLSTLQCVHCTEHCPLPDDVAAIAARLGDIPMLTGLLSMGHELQHGAMEAALTAGHINVMEFLREKGCKVDPFEYDRAANAEVAQWLYEHKGISSIAQLQRMSYKAAALGRLDVLLFTREKGVPFTEDTMSYAAEGRDHAIPTMQYLLDQGCLMDIDECYKAGAIAGTVHVLEWLTHEHGAVFDEDLLEVAAREGHINVCAYLRQLGCPWDAAACTAAVSRQKFDMLKWLVLQGCPVETEACTSAARHDDLTMLKFLREHNCPWNASTFTAAVWSWSKSMATLEYLHEQQCPWSVQTLATASELSIVQWLRERGCPWDASVCTSAAVDCDIDTLQWLHSNGCDMDTTQILYACIEQMPELVDNDEFAAVLQWVIDTCGTTVWSAEVLTNALSMCGALGFKKGAIWLREHTSVQFPELLYYENGANSAVWTDTMIAWARDEGCTSLVPQMLD